MLFSNTTWQNDIDLVLNHVDGLHQLQGSSIFVTGATGLIGTAIVHALLRYNQTHLSSFRVIATGRDMERLQEHFSDCVSISGLEFAVFDSEKPFIDPELKIDYFIHAASNASPSSMISHPVGTMMSNIIGLQYILEFALKNASKRVLFVSSSEVYGVKNNEEPFVENEYGSIDPLNPRNAYSIGKSAGETLCASYLKEFDVDSVIIRPGHIFGPTASPKDNRVASAWAFDVAAGKDIVMKSEGKQLRSYCYCLDCASAILKVLISGQAGEAYNISNKASIISIRELAELMTSHAGVQLIREIPSDSEKLAFNPMMNSSLNSSKLEALGWSGEFVPSVAVKHTIEILKEEYAR